MTLPIRSMLFKNVQRSADARGEILSIVDLKVENVSIITSNPGTIRSNHLHHDDFHLMYVLEGQIDYFFKDVETSEIKYICVKPGDNIYTPSKELHSTYFPVKTVMIVSSKNPRDQETYERDTVREALITQENIQGMLARYAK